MEFYMIYINDKINNTSCPTGQQFNSHPVTLANKCNSLESDSVSFSGNVQKPNDKNQNKLVNYIIGGLVIAGGILLAAIAIKKGKASSVAKDVKKGAEDISEKISSSSRRSSSGGGYSSSYRSSRDVVKPKANETNINIDSLDDINTMHNENIANSKEQLKQGNEKIKELDKEIERLNKDGSAASPSVVEGEIPLTKKVDTSTETIAADLDKALDMYYEKLLSKHPEFKDKKQLIKEALSGLPTIQDADIKVEVLKVITPKNKDFITKQAVPAVLRNQEVLELQHNIGATLKMLTPETVGCLDKLAASAKRFKIESYSDSSNLLKVITKDNKDFVFDELLPHLADNAEKYKISRGAHMSKFIKVITPKNKDFMLNDVLPILVDNAEKYGISNGVDMANFLKIITPTNKDFMFNEAIPTVLKNAEKLDIKGGSEIAEVAAHITPGNIENIQIVSDNIKKCNIKDKDGFFIDFKKLTSYLNKEKQELFDEFHK